MTRILISNDDGIDAPGISALAAALEEVGEVWVVAPDREKSACSNSLTMNRPLRVEQVRNRWYSVDGTPTDAVLLALTGLFPGMNFDLVASGINAGGNMGDDINYSGTVAAAKEGITHEVPSFAISLDSRKDYLWESAGQWAVRVARFILQNNLGGDTFLNVNIPNRPLSQIKGVRWTIKGKRVYGGEGVIQRSDPRGKIYYWIGGQELSHIPVDNSDLDAVAAGYVSLTPLHSDMTRYDQLQSLAEKKL